MKVSPVLLRALALAWLGTGVAIDAATLAYDGFASGGASPASDQYNSSGTYTNSALAYYDTTTTFTGGQNPATFGFSGAWNTNSSANGQTAATTYFQATNTSLTYTSSDSIALTTTNGSARDFRSGTGSTAKFVQRDLAVSGPLPTTLYFSVLVNFGADQPIEFETQSLGTNVKPFFNFGVDATGTPYLGLAATTFLTTTTTQAAASAISAGTTHLLVMKVQETTGNPTLDTMTLYVDPMLGSEGLNTAAATLSGNFYVAAMPDYELTSLFVIGAPNNGSVSFDEFKVTTDWASISVPEPGRGLLLMAGALMGIWQRKRVRRK